MRDIVSFGVMQMVGLGVSLGLMFCGCGKPQPGIEGAKVDAGEQRKVSEAAVQAGAEAAGIEGESEESGAGVGEEIDESFMDAELPQDDFVDENPEPEVAGGGDGAAAVKAKLKKFLNLDEALQAARVNGKPILLDFTGSDWCPPCMWMEGEVIGTDEFARYANENLNFVYLDFPRTRKLEKAQADHNSAIAERFNVEVFPTFVLLNSKGDELDRIVGYRPGGPQGLIEWIRKSRAR
jgi:thiol-disulfide isomerase/thioredoxin